MQKSLGRGLKSLIPEKDQKTSSQDLRERQSISAPYFPKTAGKISNQILEVNPEKIKSNPHQPRKTFESWEMDELIRSIKEYGILQPLLVTQTLAGEYELVAGERRLRAAKNLGLKKVPVIVRSAKELEKLELSLIENIQRKDLNPIEKAMAYQKLVDEFSLTHEEVGRRLSKSRSQISNTLRFLSLLPEIQKALAEGKISEGQAKIILELKDRKKQEDLYKKIIQEKLTVTDIKRQVKKVKVRSHLRRITKDPNLEVLEEKMQKALGTKVKVRKRGKQGGVVEIEFYSEEELNEIVRKIIY